MKLYEKGKLFGIFNVIDFLIVLIVLGVLISGSLYIKKITTPALAYDKLTYVIEFKNVPDELVKFIVEGEDVVETEKLYNIGKILSKTTKPSTKLIENTSEGIFEEKLVPNQTDVYVTIEANYEISGNGIDTVEDIKLDKSYEVKAGKAISAKTKSFSGQGYIYSIDK